MADIKISQETLIWLGSSLVVCAIAFATIGATAKDNKAVNIIQAAEIKDNIRDINTMKVARAETVTRQTAIIANQNAQKAGIAELKQMIGNLERAPEPIKGE